jgi:lactate dehydrogenase-like 2-hydroxyacid dehydrogenase
MRDDHSALKGLGDWLTSQGHELTIIKDTDNSDGELQHHLSSARILIIQPCLAEICSADIVAMANELDLVLTMNIGRLGKHLVAAVDRGITVVELYGEIDSVALGTMKHMSSLVPQKIADLRIGITPMGRLGQALLPLLESSGAELHYSDLHRSAEHLEQTYGLIWHAGMKDLLDAIDVLLLTKPRPDETGHWFANHQICFDQLLGQTNPGFYIVNSDSVKSSDRDYISGAVGSGHLSGYASDEWVSSPKIQGQPWRAGAWQSMTPSVIDQIQKILEQWFHDQNLPSGTLCVDKTILDIPEASWHRIYAPSQSGEYPTEIEKKLAVKDRFRH